MKNVIFNQLITPSKSKTGAICSASHELAVTMVQKAFLFKRKNIIELGPGTGVITDEILKYLPSHSSFACIEFNTILAQILRIKMMEKRVHVIEASAINLDLYFESNSCDCIISSLPWGLFDYALQKRILSQINRVLTQGGVFLSYAYWGIEKLPRGAHFKKSAYNMFSIESRSVVWRNIPPAVIYRFTKLRTA